MFRTENIPYIVVKVGVLFFARRNFVNVKIEWEMGLKEWKDVRNSRFFDRFPVSYLMNIRTAISMPS